METHFFVVQLGLQLYSRNQGRLLQIAGFLSVVCPPQRGYPFSTCKKPQEDIGFSNAVANAFDKDNELVAIAASFIKSCMVDQTQTWLQILEATGLAVEWSVRCFSLMTTCLTFNL